MADHRVRIGRERLEEFCRRVFESLALGESDAEIAASVLVAADARGIPSHGVARLPRYVHGLKIGLMHPDAEYEVLRETPSSILIDAHGGMGAPVSARAMHRVIEKAQAGGSAPPATRPLPRSGPKGVPYQIYGPFPASYRPSHPPHVGGGPRGGPLSGVERGAAG